MPGMPGIQGVPGGMFAACPGTSPRGPGQTAQRMYITCATQPPAGTPPTLYLRG